MDIKFVSIPTVVLAAATLAATPAFAQRRGGESRENHQSEHRAQATERAQPRQAPATRQEAARPAPRAEQAAPRAQQVAPRAEQAVPRAQQIAPRAVPRAEQAAPRAYTGGYAVPRTAPRSNGYSNGYYNGNHNYYYNGRYYPAPWHGWYGYAPYHPYYFRPHYSIGFGIYLGYPTPYYAYPYPVPVYGYGAPYNEVTVGPNQASYGGVSLQITPNDAAVYVDGNYAGVAADFDGTRQPLTLVPGTHHIEISQNGFQPLAFDVTVQPGMVTPYQGQLQPYER
jgi:hypothetical protein